MEEIKKKCSICGKNETNKSCTISNVDNGISYNEIIYICDGCLDIAKENFIFICINCRNNYKRNKKDMVKRLLERGDEYDFALAKGLQVLDKEQVVLGISACIQCDRETVIDYYFNGYNSGNA
jgi:hypothetical protein